MRPAAVDPLARLTVPTTDRRDSARIQDLGLLKIFERIIANQSAIILNLPQSLPAPPKPKSKRAAPSLRIPRPPWHHNLQTLRKIPKQSLRDRSAASNPQNSRRKPISPAL